MKRSKNVKYFLASLVSLLSLIVYLPALQNEFVYWDDSLYIFANPFIRSLNVGFFKWAFFTFYGSNWHPLTWISHAFDYSLWGLNPLGHHLTNIILHAVNSFIVVLLTMKLLQAVKERARQDGPVLFLHERAILIAGGVTGLLFGLHPLHVESVAWAAERKDLLCALFFLLSMMQYADYVKSVSGTGTHGVLRIRYQERHYLLAVGFFILALSVNRLRLNKISL